MTLTSTERKALGRYFGKKSTPAKAAAARANGAKGGRPQLEILSKSRTLAAVLGITRAYSLGLKPEWRATVRRSLRRHLS